MKGIVGQLGEGSELRPPDRQDFAAIEGVARNGGNGHGGCHGRTGWRPSHLHKRADPEFLASCKISKGTATCQAGSHR